jgi:hypothetical protein
MAFGIGGSVAKNQSSSQSTSGSNSLSQSLSQSQSTQGSVQQSSQSIAFAPLFAALYGNAGSAAANAADAVPGLQGAAQQLFTGGSKFLDTLQGNPGTDYLTSRVTGPDEAAQAQIGALGSSLGDFFNEQLLPGITSTGVSTGGYGNSRDAVARSLAAKQVAGQFSQGAAQILSTSQGQRDQAATALGAQTGQNAATGLSALNPLFSLLQGGANAGLAPLQQLAAIMGGPTTLSTSSGSSYGQSTAEDIANAISSSFGQSSSQSSGKAISAQVGI